MIVLSSYGSEKVLTPGRNLREKCGPGGSDNSESLRQQSLDET